MAGGELNDALSAIGNLGKALQSTTKQYKESADELRTMHGDTRGAKNRRADAEKKAEIELTKDNAEALGELYKQTMRLKVEQKKGTGVTERSRKQLRYMAQNLKDLNIKGTSKVFEKHLDIMAGDAKLTSAEIKKFGEIISKQVSKQEQKLSGDIKEFQSQNRLQRGLDKLTDRVKSTTRTFFSMEVGIANITSGFARSFNELEFAQQHQIDMYSGMASGVNSLAYSMSLAPEEMQKFVVANKKLILSSAQTYDNVNNAVKQSVNVLTTANAQGQTLQNEAYKLTGDYGKASMLLGGTMTMLKKSGENLTFDELKKQSFSLLKQFKGLSQISDKSSQEIAALTSNFLENDTIRQKMNAMQSNKERQQFVKDTLASAERNRKLGFSIEQSFKIAESMAGLSQTKTKDRIKQSAVTAQLAGALGLTKEAQTVQRLGRKKFRDPKEQQELQEALGRIGDAAAVRSGEQGARGESFNLYLDRVTDNMGTFAELMRMSNTTTVKGNALSEDQVKAVQSQESNLSGMTSIMQDFKQSWDEYAKPFFQDPSVQIVGGILGGIGDILGGTLGHILGGYLANTGIGKIGPMLAGLLPKFLAVGPLLVKSAGIFGSMLTGLLPKLSAVFSSLITASVGKIGPVLTGLLPKFSAIGPSLVAAGQSIISSSAVAAGTQVAAAGAAGYAVGTAGVKFTQQLDEWFGTDMWGSVVDSVGSAVAEIGGWFSDDIAHQQRMTAQLKAMENMSTKEQADFMAGQKLEDLAKEKGITKEELKTMLVEKAKIEGNNMAEVIKLVTHDIKNPMKTKSNTSLKHTQSAIKDPITKTIQDIPTPVQQNANLVVDDKKTKDRDNETTEQNELLRQLVDQTIITNKGINKMDKSVNQTARQQIEAAKERDEELNADSRLGRVRRQFAAL